LSNELVIEHKLWIGSIDDRAKSQFRLVRRADLAHENDIERRLQRLGHLERHWNATAGKREDNRMGILVRHQPFRELAAGIAAILENIAISRSPRWSGQELRKPLLGMVRDVIQGAGLLEQMPGPRNDHQVLRAAEVMEGGLVHPDHRPVGAADNEEGWRTHQFQGIAGKIGPPAAGYDGTDVASEPCCGDQCCSRSRARSKIADRKISEVGSPADPSRGDDKTRRQQIDIEHVATIPFLLRLQQIQQQGRQSCLLQDRGNVLITRAQATTTAAMRENDDAFRHNGQPD
jgi:hypothetical protein